MIPRWDLGQHPMIITLLFLHWNVWLFTLSGVSKGCKKLHFSPCQFLIPNDFKKKTHKKKHLIFFFFFLELLDFGIMRERQWTCTCSYFCFLTFIFFLTHSNISSPHVSQMILANSTNDLYLKGLRH